MNKVYFLLIMIFVRISELSSQNFTKYPLLGEHERMYDFEISSNLSFVPKSSFIEPSKNVFVLGSYRNDMFLAKTDSLGNADFTFGINGKALFFLDEM